jgi:hypothetical protein
VKNKHTLSNYLKVVVLLIVAAPEDSEYHEADKIAYKSGAVMSKRKRKFVNWVSIDKLGHFQLEYQNCHRNCEYTIKEKLQPSSVDRVQWMIVFFFHFSSRFIKLLLCRLTDRRYAALHMLVFRAVACSAIFDIADSTTPALIYFVKQPMKWVHAEKEIIKTKTYARHVPLYGSLFTSHALPLGGSAWLGRKP